MKQLQCVQYSLDDMHIDAATLEHARKQRALIASTIKTASADATYSSFYASIYCPFDKIMQQHVQARANVVGAVDLLIVVGIGGSSLGFHAVYQVLQDQATLKPNQVIILETVDAPSTAVALHQIKSALDNNKKVHVCVISKSGITTETVALWRIVQATLSAHARSWARMVTIITDADSPLDKYAQKQTIAVLTVPRLVGGRYSVFSPVGLLPLALCGVDTAQLCTGARDAITAMIAEKNSMPLEHAAAIFTAYHKNYAVHDTFIFSQWCGAIGLWYRQLAAESLGKMRADKKLFSMLPTVSIGSTDLHSIGQLYLSGANNFWTTFMIVQEHKNISINHDEALGDVGVSLSEGSLSEIMDAIVQGTIKAYRNRGIPFSSITLAERSPHAIGYLLQSYMLAIIYAGTLLQVNPFDQPDVERYKEITRDLLRR